jgi:hypothetical protein
MRRLVALFLLASMLLPVSDAVVNAAESQKVFMFVREGSRDLDLMLKEEVSVMQQMLENAGYAVDIATPADEPMVAATITLTPTVKLADVDIANYAGVILPCMAPAEGSPIPAKVDAIAEQAVAMGKPFAASRGSVETLAKAGGINDREYAYAGAVDIAKRPEFAHGKFLGTGVVRDGNINTAGICPLASRSLNLPDGTVGLTQSFIESLNEAS